MSDNYNSWWYKPFHAAARLISDVQWSGLVAKLRGPNGKGYNLTDADQDQIKQILAGGYYIILVNRYTHLSTVSIGLLTMAKTGQWPDYSHALMNLDLETDPANFEKFKLMEATNDGKGVGYVDFMDVFNCDAVCLLQPVNLDPAKWEAVMEGLAEQMGKPYDDLFNIKDASHVSCVEMVLDSLRKDPDYAKDFANLEAAIQKYGNLTPQMYRDCPDFKVVFEVKR